MRCIVEESITQSALHFIKIMECQVKTVCENGVSIEVGDEHDKPTHCKTFYNPVMQVCRELVLCALCAHVDNCAVATKEKDTLKCLEAFGATGIAGMQWKRHLEDKVEVTVSDVNPASVKNICRNCTHNQLSVQRLLPGGKHDASPSSAESPGEIDRGTDGTDGEPRHAVEVVCGDANVIMHSRQFHFIHVDPFGTTVQFLEAAFRNVYNGGVVILTSTDIAALFGKCKEVLWRNYSARTARADYIKEMAVRIVIGAAARASARCNKGFSVLYAVAVEHFVQVAVRIQRGAKHANSCLTHVNNLLHCPVCQEWAIIPDSDSPIENHSSLLRCLCCQENAGTKPLILGPMWCDSIFQTDFLNKMQQCSSKLNLSVRVQQLLSVVLEEARCTRHLATVDSSSNVTGSSDATLEGDVTSPSEPGRKRALDSSDHGGETPESSKKLKTESGTSAETAPMFYFNLQKRKMKNTSLPKLSRLVTRLRQAGYRASRSHFDDQAVRTNASLSQLRDFLQKPGARN